MADPLVSVTIPVRNGEQFLRQALDSVLAQSYRPVEVIVVDDGSTDATPEIVKQYGTVVLIPVAGTPGTACGTQSCIASANGEYLAFSPTMISSPRTNSKSRSGILSLTRDSVHSLAHQILSGTRLRHS